MNVLDKFSGLDPDHIKNELKKDLLPFAILMFQLERDFNIGTVIRNANAFGAKCVYYYGPNKKIDRRGCVGTYKYTDYIHLSSEQEVLDLKNQYSFVGLEINKRSKPIESFQWKKSSLIVIGEEQNGIPDNFIDHCDDVVHITQRGSVRSLNAGTASGIAMFSYGKFVNQ